MGKLSRKKSNKQTTKMREKIKKKIKEHKRKIKRDAKKNPKSTRRKDPGVPNSLPFKEKVLKEAVAQKQKLEDQRLRQKERAKKERQKLVDKKRNLGSLVKDADKKNNDFERKQAAKRDVQSDFTAGKHVEQSRKAFYKEFKKVIDSADVVLEVLDARDPIGSRCRNVEDAIIGSGANKKLVLVLNKIDLVPRDNVEAWLKYLRNEFPAVAFKASTQSQNTHLNQTKNRKISVISDDLLKSSRCLGADMLMKLLGNYCRNEGIKTSIRVGVVGLPNTGKSSIINSLRRTKVCNVGATPGVTRLMQEVSLDKHIKLIDSPGVVMTTSSSDTSIILRNCTKVEAIDDPVKPLEAILRRCSKSQIMLHYNIPDFNNSHEFLCHLARRLGQLKKGGVPATTKAAKRVLQDWMSGKITYYTHPPENSTSHISAEIVTQLGKSFDIDAILAEENQILNSLDNKSEKHMLVDTLGAAATISNEADIADDDDDMADNGNGQLFEEEEWEDEEMDGSDGENQEEEKELKKVTVKIPDAKKSKLISKKLSKGDTEKADVQSILAGNVQINKEKKKAYKQMKKQRKRSDKVAESLSNVFTGAMTLDADENAGGGDDYNFATDFK